GKSEENLQSPLVTKKDLKQKPSDKNFAKQINNSKNDTKNIDKYKDDENPNLANLSTPAPTTIYQN
ncbi:hypothetical protein NAI78_12205, partial [Francisella tularensis subsp. holarctica]|nr:hypothetical protein [Francisella tularensis subsp. holarctica]